MAMELKTTGVNGFVKPAELTNMETLLNAVNDELLTGKGAGSDFLGWLDLPVNYDKEEFARIQKAAKKIQSDSDVLVVIGIGGSYLGARAAIEFCKGQMYNGVREKGIPAFGPEKKAAIIEGSKVFAKELMKKYGKALSAVHIKEMDKRTKTEAREYPNAIVGEGKSDCEKAIKLAKQMGINLFILEVEGFPCEVSEYLKKSCDKMKEFAAKY